MSSTKAENKKELDKKKYEKYQKELDGKARHEFRGCVAAARILFGAYSSGDIDSTVFSNAASNLARVVKDNFNYDSRVNINEYVKNSDPYQQTLKTDNSLAKSLGNKKILFIDDEYKTIGWNIVLDAIFGSGKVLYADSIDNSRMLISENETSIAAVLLDMKLPTTPEEGLGFLKEIKKKYIDLPVIMFTAEDSSKYVKKCFQYGAFDYFVKEFEGGDRDSLDYYLKLKEVLIEAFSQEAWREIWRMISALEKKLQEKGPPFYSEVIDYLRKSYFFLTTDSESWSASMLLSNRNLTTHGETILQCALALETIIGKLYKLHKNKPEMKELLGTRKFDEQTLGQQVGKLRTINAISNDMEKRLDSVNKLRNESVHSERIKTFSEKQVSEVVIDTISLLEEIIFIKLMA